MIDFLNKSAAKDAIHDYEYNVVPNFTMDRRHMGDRDLRYVLWYALFKQDFHYDPIMKNDGTAKKVLDVFYNDAQVQALQKQFSGKGTVWNFRDGRDGSYLIHFIAKNPPVDFDPPYIWDGRVPSALFHKAPPQWYDPWGYNRPGDFLPTQPAATYFDPFCFNGNLRFPQRPVALESGFKGRQWAVFTDTDEASLQASARPGSESSETTPQDPEVTSEPSVLVVRTLGRRTFASLLTPERGNAMVNIRNQLDEQARQYGAQVLDVRIKRADLPQGTPLQAAFTRMQSDRQEEAETIRAGGRRDAQIIRAEAEANAARIYADAFNKDPEFYDFFRAMQSYRQTFMTGDGSSSIIMDESNDYLRQFRGGR
jgi:hypothetical protein